MHDVIARRYIRCRDWTHLQNYTVNLNEPGQLTVAIQNTRNEARKLNPEVIFTQPSLADFRDFFR